MGFCKAYKNKRGYGFDQNIKYESIDNNECVAYVCESNEILVDVDNPNAVKYFEAVLDYYNIPDSMKHKSKSGGMHYLFTIPNGMKIPFKSRYNHDVKVTRTYGTDRINALHILERTLNMKSVAVTDEVVCNTNSSGKKRVINQSETILAIEKQNKMIKAFFLFL